MKFILLLTIVLSSACCLAQSFELKERVILTHMLRRLDKEQKYDSIIRLAGKLPFHDSVYLYGTESFLVHAYLNKGDTIKAMQFLVKAIENQDIKAVENLNYEFKQYKLDSNKRYQYIVANFDKLHSRYNNRLNESLMMDCLEIYFTDTRMRFLYMNARGDSILQRTADILQWRSDSMNIEKMKTIFRTYGRYPGISDIGKTLTLNFTYIVAHFASALNQDTLYSFLKDATRKGEIPNWLGPHILDKSAYYNNRPLIYGEFGNSDNYKNGVYHYSPIKDINAVDKRRAEFLLLPLYKQKEVRDCVLPEGYDAAKQKK